MTPLVFSRLPVTGFPITGGFGQVEGYGYAHRGVDIGCPDGTPVRAPAGGRVVAFTNDGSFGWKAVCLEHPGTGLFSLYAHLMSNLVVTGEWVNEGELIGLSGHEGKVSGPHLHFQVCVTTEFPVDIAYSRDPLSFLQEDPMEPYRLALHNIAGGSFSRMVECYTALDSAGFFAEQNANDGVANPIDGKDDLNDSEVRRWRLIALAASDRAADAYQALGGKL